MAASRGIPPRGPRSRAAGLAWFAWVALGLNTAIEASVFIRTPGMGCAAVVAALFAGSRDGTPFGARARALFAARPARQWAWRLGLAWLAFPAVYYLFGALLMAACPWALTLYRQGVAGLTIPPVGLVVQVQLLRSALFLASALPVLALWRGSRRSLVIALGLAYWVLVGLFGLVQGTWMPAGLRVAHSVETLADSMVYAWALVALLVPAAKAEANEVAS